MDSDSMAAVHNYGETSKQEANWTMYQHYAMGPINVTFVTITSVLSVMGSILIFTTYLTFKELRTTLRRLIVYLSIADFCVAFGNLAGLILRPEPPPNYPCVIQSFVTTTASLWSFFWTATVALYLYVVLVRSSSDKMEKLLYLFHLVNWTVPLILNVALASLKKLGNSADAMTAGWCWIHVDASNVKEQHQELVLYMLIDGKIVEILSYFIVLLLYCLVRRHVRKVLRLSHSDTEYRRLRDFETRTIRNADIAKTVDRKMLLVPILFVFVRMWGTIRFFMFAAGIFERGKLEWYEEALITMQGIGDSAQGFVNCILFCFLTPKVRNLLKKSVVTLFCSFSSQSEQDSLNERATLLPPS